MSGNFYCSPHAVDRTGLAAAAVGRKNVRAHLFFIPFLKLDCAYRTFIHTRSAADTQLFVNLRILAVAWRDIKKLGRQIHFILKPVQHKFGGIGIPRFFTHLEFRKEWCHILIFALMFSMSFPDFLSISSRSRIRPALLLTPEYVSPKTSPISLLVYKPLSQNI